MVVFYLSILSHGYGLNNEGGKNWKGLFLTGKVLVYLGDIFPTLKIPAFWNDSFSGVQFSANGWVPKLFKKWTQRSNKNPELLSWGGLISYICDIKLEPMYT